MILLCGIPTERPLDLVRRQLDRRRVPYVWFDQRRADDIEMAFEVADGGVTGRLHVAGATSRLDAFTGVYTRLMDDRLLPQFKGEPDDSPRRTRCRTVHDTLAHWCEIAPVRVVNRAGPMASNYSKPYQAQLIEALGFRIPETLITNDPDCAREFCSRHTRVVYKSISSIRSIVRLLDEDAASRLERIRWCPVQFQACIEGTNVRVHVVGEQVFATAIHTDAIDYRYATRDGRDATLMALRLPDPVAQRCAELARALDLPLAGIDLKVAPDGQLYCFEVNPSPAFSYYEERSGQPIAEAVAGYLAGE
jgi:glutathione synthase/RimK-type ligase-like ATP-grasp enzyme